VFDYANRFCHISGGLGGCSVCCLVSVVVVVVHLLVCVCVVYCILLFCCCYDIVIAIDIVF